VGLGIGLALADSSVVTLALPDILARFDLEITTVAWVLISYNLVLALGAVPAAYVARRNPAGQNRIGQPERGGLRQRQRAPGGQAVDARLHGVTEEMPAHQ